MVNYEKIQAELSVNNLRFLLKIKEKTYCRTLGEALRYALYCFAESEEGKKINLIKV